MALNLDVLLFGPGLPATGQRGTLRPAADHIEISWSDTGATAEAAERDFDGGSITCAIGELAFAEVGFGKPGLELKWTDDRGELWLAHVLDPAAATALRTRADWSALPSLAQLNRQQQRLRSRRRLGWAAIGLLVLSPVLLLLLFLSQAGRVADAITARIPIEQEVRLGREAFESMRGTLKLQGKSPAQEVVANIGGRLTTGSRYQYEFHGAEDASLNAFALPGGIVVVNTGLLAATKRPEELAGVLAHEVQHVELRHGTAAIVKDLGWRMLWAWFSGDWGGSLAGQAAAELGSLKFSRDAETAADQAGFDALVRAGMDPSGMPDFFAIMAKQAPDAPAGFLSTHPLSTDREQALRGRLSTVAGRQFTPLMATLDLPGWPLPVQGPDERKAPM